MYLRGYYPETNHPEVLHATQKVFESRYRIGLFAQEKLLELARFDMDIGRLAHECCRKKWSSSPDSAADFLLEKIHDLQQAVQEELDMNQITTE